MNSDPAKQQSAHDVAVKRYSRTNPPLNVEAALSTIDRLDTDVASIEAKLNHADPDMFPNDEKYLAWRRKAISALAYTRQELAFLEKWVGGQQQSSHQSRRQAPGSRGINDKLNKIAESIRTRARELADEIGNAYAPIYSSTIQPESLSVAQERMSYLVEVKVELQCAFSEVTASWTDHPLRRDEMPGVKAPLQKILTRVEVEIGVVKKYIRTSAMNSHNTQNWKCVCAKALTRAVAEGFVLLPTEQEVLEKIQSLIKFE